MVIGAVCTLIIIVLLVAVRLRRGHGLRFTFRDLKTATPTAQPDHHQRLVAVGTGNGGSASSKPLLRSVSPREALDEQDPDVIPAKYGKYIIMITTMLSLWCLTDIKARASLASIVKLCNSLKAFASQSDR